MSKLVLVVKRTERFVLPTDSKHALPVAESVLNRDFAATDKNRVWTTDITYISRRLHKTLGDWTPIEFEQCA
jgi:putative transposase